MGIKYSNNATTSLPGTVSNSTTSITVTDASVFPDISGAADYCYLTLASSVGLEIIKATSITGNTITCVRAQDNTDAKSFVAGDKCELRLTTAMLQTALQETIDAAAASASGAAASEAAAAATYDNFDDRYLGQKASEPTLDNDGNALVTGALFFNSTTNIMMVYSGSAWQGSHPSATEQTNVNTVATNIANVNTVGTNIGNVNTVGGISANVTTVAGISSDVTAVAGNNANVSTVAGVSANVTAVAGVATETGLLGNTATIADMALLGTSDCVADMAMLATADIIADMNALATSDIISDLNTLATSDIVNDLNTLATADVVNDMNVLGTAQNVTNMNTVAGVAANVTTVAGISGNVTTVAGIAANTTTVAGIASDVTAVAGKTAQITLLGTADAIADMNTLGSAQTVADLNALGSAATVQDLSDVADNITGINSFADRYRVQSTNPTTSLDQGDLVFNTTDTSLKFYDGTTWNAIATGGIGSLQDDTTPQLGGPLDVNGQAIESVSNGNIAITPHGTGDVILDGIKYPQADGTAGQFLKTNGSGQLAFETIQGGDLSTQGATFANYNTISSDCTSTLVATKNHFLKGAISVTGNNTWTIAGTGTLTLM